MAKSKNSGLRTEGIASGLDFVSLEILDLWQIVVSHWSSDLERILKLNRRTLNINHAEHIVTPLIYSLESHPLRDYHRLWALSACVESVSSQDGFSRARHRWKTWHEEYLPLGTLHDAPAHCVRNWVLWEDCGSRIHRTIIGPMQHRWQPYLQGSMGWYGYLSARRIQIAALGADRRRDIVNDRQQTIDYHANHISPVHCKHTDAAIKNAFATSIPRNNQAVCKYLNVAVVKIVKDTIRDR